MIISGWRKCSLVDVRGHVSFTLWMCGCNLRCPFCHNYRVAEADPSICRKVSVNDVIEELSSVRRMVEYLHVTGGEPLLQDFEVANLFAAARSIGVKTSLNSNLTIPESLKMVVGLMDHAATDAKVPHAMYGVPYWRKMYERFLESVEIIGDHGIPLELRVPLSRIDLNEYISVIDDVVSKAGNVYVVISRVVCEPVVTPRDSIWCRSHALDDGEYKTVSRALADYVKSLGITVHVI